MSYNLNNAITGTYPNYSVDYPNALVSRGNLAGGVNGAAASTNPAEVDLSWDDNSGSGGAQVTDKALIVILNPTKGEAVYTTAGAARSATAETLNVPSNFTGDDVEVFLGFISEDGTKVSNSSYLGSVTVA
mgnify:FL=1